MSTSRTTNLAPPGRARSLSTSYRRSPRTPVSFAADTVTGLSCCTAGAWPPLRWRRAARSCDRLRPEPGGFTIAAGRAASPAPSVEAARRCAASLLQLLEAGAVELVVLRRLADVEVLDGGDAGRGLVVGLGDDALPDDRLIRV